MQGETKSKKFRAVETGAVPHVETHVGSWTGERIRMTCTCAISSDHTYLAWLNLTKAPPVDF